MNNLIENKFFDIIIYTYTFSSIDLKCIFIKLFKEISNILYKDQVNFKIFFDKILTFLTDHLLTDNLLFPEEENQIEKIEKIKLKEKSHSNKNLIDFGKKIKKKNLSIESTIH